MCKRGRWLIRRGVHERKVDAYIGTISKFELEMVFGVDGMASFYFDGYVVYRWDGQK